MTELEMMQGTDPQELDEDDIRGMLGAIFRTLAPRLGEDELTKEMAEIEAILRDVVRTGEWKKSLN